ncbi:hypothetical protein GCM10011409_33990 [Lentibacillus populi]|uniref:Sporulation protein n=1 Tax=Lentibacillus populi TaxID=1827502 RepID=A0A9W5U145_9BACI|nr:hypothetical protein [Lentibacillus populi]MBT2216232.1 hypothetical protein [Virgibacillus dakarensis]GGB53567.1 hypothetical protein GCM10011409_33990 [Lentibacillus populi]
MKVKKLIVWFGLILFLTSCTQDTDTNSANDDQNDEFTKFTKISSDNFIDQDAANQAKKVLTKYEEIKTIKAVNTSKYLVVGIEVHHNKRFQLTDLRKEFTKTLKKKFPKFKTELSTDKKMLIELDRLENDINGNNISNKQLEKEVKHIIKLSKEQT